MQLRGSVLPDMLRGYIIVALFLLPDGEIFKIDQSSNTKVYQSTEACEKELSSVKEDLDYLRIKYPGNDQIFYQKNIGDHSLRLTCVEVTMKINGNN